MKFVLDTKNSITRKWNLNLKTTDNLLAANVYVSFRSKNPDEATVKEVLKELQNNNVDISQLLELKADHCQEAESSTAGGSSA